MVRALPCHGRGYGFEPRHSRHFSLEKTRKLLPSRRSPDELGPMKKSVFKG